MKIYRITWTLSPLGLKQSIKEIDCKETTKSYTYTARRVDNTQKRIPKTDIGTVRGSLITQKQSFVTYSGYTLEDGIVTLSQDILKRVIERFKQFEYDYISASKHLKKYLSDGIFINNIQ